MKKIVLLLSLFSTLVFADAVIFSGSDVKALKPNIDLNGVTKVMSGSLNPSAGAGIVAPTGSVYLSKVFGIWNKTGAGNTAWTKISLLPVDLVSDISGILGIANGGTGSNTKNFVDLTTGQTVAGTKTFSSPIVGSVTGNAATVTTNANLTGMVTSVGNATTVVTNANLTGDVTSVGNATTYNGVVPVSKGGTGSATQNFVDLSSTQTVGGTKTFSNPISGSVTGNAATVTTNANLTGMVTSVGNATTVVTNANLTGGVTSVGNATTVVTNANLTGEVTSVGNATTVTNSAVIAKTLTGYTAGAGTITSADSIVSAIQKNDGNNALKLGLTKSEVDGAAVTTTELNVPLDQLTTIGTNKRRIETGNDNILGNPGMEATALSPWSCPLGTGSVTTNALVAGSVYTGSQALKIVSIGAGVRCIQSVTTNAASHAGQQMNLKLMVSSTDPLFQVCSSEGGTSSSFDFNCKTVPVATAAKPWQPVIIPFLGNGTSNGIVFKSATTTTQNIYVDDAHVGDGLPANAGIINSTPWTTYNATVNSFGTTSPTTNFCKYRTVSTDVEVTCDLASTGTMTATLASISLPNSWTIDTSRINVANTTSASGQAVGHWVNAGAGNFGSIVTATGTSTSVVYFGSTNGGVSMLIPTSGNAIITNAALSVRFKVPVAALSGYASSAFLSENADTSYVPCSFSTLAWQGLGNVTSSLECKRDGDVLRMRGRLDIGTVTASTIQIPLPNNWGTITTKSTLSANTSAGYYHRGATGTSIFYATNLQPSVGYIQTSQAIIYAANNPVIAVGGTTAYANNETLIFPEITIPIQGWTNSNLIVGSFENIEKCATVDECTDIYSAKISSVGAKSDENVSGWLTGACVVSPTGVVKCPTNKFTVVPNCWATDANGNSGGTYQAHYMYGNSTATSLEFRTTLAGTLSAAAFTIGCQKTGADSKPKTAKIASSIGVPTVPGIVGVAVGDRIDTFSVSYGTTNATTVCSASPCSYLDQIGTAVSSITRSGAGAYSLNTSKTYTKLKCGYVGIEVSGYTAGFQNSNLACTSCSALTFSTQRISTGVVGDTYGTIMCQGSY